MTWVGLTHVAGSSSVCFSFCRNQASGFSSIIHRVTPDSRRHSSFPDRFEQGKKSWTPHSSWSNLKPKRVLLTNSQDPQKEFVSSLPTSLCRKPSEWLNTPTVGQGCHANGGWYLPRKKRWEISCKHCFPLGLMHVMTQEICSSWVRASCTGVVNREMRHVTQLSALLTVPVLWVVNLLRVTKATGSTRGHVPFLLYSLYFGDPGPYRSATPTWLA